MNIISYLYPGLTLLKSANRRFPLGPAFGIHTQKHQHNIDNVLKSKHIPSHNYIATNEQITKDIQIYIYNVYNMESIKQPNILHLYCRDP